MSPFSLSQAFFSNALKFKQVGHYFNIIDQEIVDLQDGVIWTMISYKKNNILIRVLG
jgi:hypothetical protein